ncbi:type II secretion system GspH family protein [Virgibacillus necropolis]|uniref:prepilin-type N-terminal cleavage/methylation domain-containing protein n=1 Tax=Virgibacillus necropolis TaxID=163877 RepID=UPI0038514B8A
MKKFNGFSLIEVLVAFGIVTMLVVTVFPISIQIKKEQQKLSDRITIATQLYDELQLTIWSNSDLPKTYNKQFESKPLTFHFKTINNLTQGCVEWTNVKNEKEKTCLFGYPG